MHTNFKLTFLGFLMVFVWVGAVVAEEPKPTTRTVKTTQTAVQLRAQCAKETLPLKKQLLDKEVELQLLMADNKDTAQVSQELDKLYEELRHKRVAFRQKLAKNGIRSRLPRHGRTGERLLLGFGWGAKKRWQQHGRHQRRGGGPGWHRRGHGRHGKGSCLDDGRRGRRRGYGREGQGPCFADGKRGFRRGFGRPGNGPRSANLSWSEFWDSVR